MTFFSSIASSLRAYAEKSDSVDAAPEQQRDGLKAKVASLASNARVQNVKANAAKMGKDALNYAKENPAEVLLGIMTLMVYDVTETLEDIEAHEEIETAIAVAEYIDAQ